MRIDPEYEGAASTRVGPGSVANSRSAAAQSEAGSAADSAQLSPDQVRVQALVAQVNALPEIRQDGVDALGRAVREGNYQVSAEQTAAAMVSDIGTTSRSLMREQARYEQIFLTDRLGPTAPTIAPTAQAEPRRREFASFAASCPAA